VADEWVEAPLPNEALVVRGGRMENYDHMVEDALLELRRVQYAGLSVRAGVDVTVDQLVRAGRPLPNGAIRVSTVERLRDGGLPLAKLPGPYHYNIVIRESVNVEVMASLAVSLMKRSPILCRAVRGESNEAGASRL
jgi:hypothetical protein